MDTKLKLALSYLAKLRDPLWPFDDLDEKVIPVDLRTAIILEYVHKEDKWLAEAQVNFRTKAVTDSFLTAEEALDELLSLLAEKVSNGE